MTTRIQIRLVYSMEVARNRTLLRGRMIRFGPKVGQISLKWAKSGDFFKSDSVHFGSPSEATLEKTQQIQGSVNCELLLVTSQICEL